jgi:hypothetical protein
MVGVQFDMKCPKCGKDCFAEDNFKGRVVWREVWCRNCGLDGESDMFLFDESSDEELNLSILNNTETTKTYNLKRRNVIFAHDWFQIGNDIKNCFEYETQSGFDEISKKEAEFLQLASLKDIRDKYGQNTQDIEGVKARFGMYNDKEELPKFAIINSKLEIIALYYKYSEAEKDLKPGDGIVPMENER